MRWLTMMGVSFTLTLFVAEMAVVSGMRLAYRAEYPDPFAPYEMLMPGQPVTADSYRLCPPYVVPFMEGYMAQCHINPTDVSPFEWVIASVDNDYFQKIKFHAEGLSVGDLVRRWGRPAFVAGNEHYFYVRWEQGLFAIVEPGGRTGQFDYLLPVQHLIVGIEAAQPDPSG